MQRHHLFLFYGNSPGSDIWKATRSPGANQTPSASPSISQPIQRLNPVWQDSYEQLAERLLHGTHFQFSSVAQSCLTLCDPACQAFLSITNSQSPHKPMSIESVMPSNHLIFCCPLLLLPSIFPSIRVFSNESVLHIRWPNYRSFIFSISPFNEHPGRISYRMDWLDLLAVQGTIKSLLQHHSSKASSAFSFIYSLTLTSIHDYWKNHSLD